jgi:hypothetical protein
VQARLRETEANGAFGRRRGRPPCRHGAPKHAAPEIVSAADVGDGAETVVGGFRAKPFAGVLTFAPSSPVIDDNNDRAGFWVLTFVVEYQFDQRGWRRIFSVKLQLTTAAPVRKDRSRNFRE